MESRKPNRLEGYDYSSQGAYFITICTDNRRRIFSRITVGALHEAPECRLTKYGEILKTTLEEIPAKYENAMITDYVIMPNHIHMIIYLRSDERAIRESPLRTPRRSEISKIVGYLKMNVSKRIHETHPDAKIWQRGYYDHVIRDEDDYIVKANYILGNPFQWTDDEYYVN